MHTETESAAARMIREFHAAMGEQPHGIEWPTEDRAWLRQRMLLEEVRELSDGIAAQSITEIADALADIVYVVYGTAFAYGIPLDAVLAEVHRSNMSKDFSGPKGDRKVKKGAGYQRPEIAAVLADGGWESHPSTVDDWKDPDRV